MSRLRSLRVQASIGLVLAAAACAAVASKGTSGEDGGIVPLGGRGST